MLAALNAEDLWKAVQLRVLEYMYQHNAYTDYWGI